MMNALKWAKFFALLGFAFGLVSIGCTIAVFMELVRGFFQGFHHWWYMIGWSFGATIFRSVALSYRDTSREYMQDSLEIA